jgi:hypothetical protein
LRQRFETQSLTVQAKNTSQVIATKQPLTMSSDAGGAFALGPVHAISASATHINRMIPFSARGMQRRKYRRSHSWPVDSRR